MKNTFVTKTTTTLTPTEETREKRKEKHDNQVNSILKLIQAEMRKKKLVWKKNALIPFHIFFAYFYICCSCSSPLLPSLVSLLLRLEVLEQQTGSNHKIILKICFFSTGGDSELILLAPLILVQISFG